MTLSRRQYPTERQGEIVQIVIDSLKHTHQWPTAKDIARKMGLTEGSVMSMVTHMRNRGVLVKHPDTGRMMLGHYRVRVESSI